MTKFITTAAVAALALGLCAEAAQAQSRGETSDDRRSGVYVAAGDVNGDGRADGGRSGGRDIDSSDGAETAGLLVPAVQRVREAASQDAEEAGSPDQVQSDQGQAGAIAIPSLIRSRRSSGSY